MSWGRGGAGNIIQAQEDKRAMEVSPKLVGGSAHFVSPLSRMSRLSSYHQLWALQLFRHKTPLSSINMPTRGEEEPATGIRPSNSHDRGLSAQRLVLQHRQVLPHQCLVRQAGMGRWSCHQREQVAAAPATLYGDLQRRRKKRESGGSKRKSE